MKHAITIALLAIFLTASAALCVADETRDHVCFGALDANEDGKVTFQEFAKAYGDDRQKYDQADIDKDGTLTHDEYHDLLGHGST